MLQSSPEAWYLWLQMPETQDYRRELESLARQEEVRLGQGHYLDPESAEKTLAQVSQAVGRLEGISLALRLGPEIPDPHPPIRRY